MSEKDKNFLEKLRKLMDSEDLRVDLRPGQPSYMVLKGTYGEKIHETFGVTRQGVRWRFQHLFGQAYVRAFETIMFIEKIFGSRLRDYAIRISKERYALRQKALQISFESATDVK
jgi:hypothetical protein